jgi:hypothetical protein
MKYAIKESDDYPESPDYLYLGDRLTDPSLKGKPCSAMKRNGKCIISKEGTMLVNFDGINHIVIARLLRKV